VAHRRMVGFCALQLAHSLSGMCRIRSWMQSRIASSVLAVSLFECNAAAQRSMRNTLLSTRLAVTVVSMFLPAAGQYCCWRSDSLSMMATSNVHRLQTRCVLTMVLKNSQSSISVRSPPQEPVLPLGLSPGPNPTPAPSPPQPPHPMPPSFIMTASPASCTCVRSAPAPDKIAARSGHASRALRCAFQQIAALHQLSACHAGSAAEFSPCDMELTF